MCGGVAEYFDVDATLVRAGFAVATVLTGGALIIAYVALLFIMPNPDGTTLAGGARPGQPAGTAGYPAAPAGPATQSPTAQP